jgi:hypothetical protein
MKSLLNNAFAPITFSWGFLQAPLETVKDAMIQWHSSLGRKETCTPINDALPKALLNLDPLSMPPHKELLFSTQSTWTAYSNNSILGTDTAGIGYLAQRIKCWGVSVDCAPNTSKSYGAVGFTLFAPEKREWLNEERSILAMNDGGRWTFFTRGEALPFEQTECYEKKKIADRFTFEMLEEYCKHYEIDVFNSEFYGSQGYLIIDRSSYTKKIRRLSLNEARRKLGLY